MAFHIVRCLRDCVVAGLMVAAGVSGAWADATEPVADIEGASDNALAKRYEGSFIVYHQKLDYTDFEAPLSPLVKVEGDATDASNNRIFRPEKSVEAEGTRSRIAYVTPAGRSPLEVLRNYQDVVEENGGEVLFECKADACGGDAKRAASGGGGWMSLMQYFFSERDLAVKSFSTGDCALNSKISDQRYFTAKTPVEAGDALITVHTYQLQESTYCKALAGRTVAVVQVLEPKARDKKMVLVEAEKMADSLAESGGISLYGIYFDTDKADIKPESEPTLAEVAKLLKADQKLAIIVVGHTDNQGSFDYNLDLSSRRAAAVKAALSSQFGIDAKRMTAAGAGMMAPVATNDTEEGRAKNRRVALVKAN